ncbi:MAG: NAD(P)H-binding protein [Leptospira sp.]|nr:NAD(P)H-binding protein [Leptospira sp.]
MGTILITGGTGVLGKKLCSHLLSAGKNKVRIFSRNPPSEFTSLEWARVDLSTGKGISDALAGVDIIFHLASGTAGGFNAKTDINGTAMLLEEAKKKNVTHFIYISIVGTDKVPYKYYKYKWEAEKLIQNAGLPFTILRSTQFYDFIGMILGKIDILPFILFLPKKFKFQPIETLIVAQKLGEIMNAGPKNRIENIGGPEILSFGEIGREWIASKKSNKRVLNFPFFGPLGNSIEKGNLTCSEKSRESRTWNNWLALNSGIVAAK